MISRLGAFDRWLCDASPRPDLTGGRRLAVEFLFFGLKEARACLFVGLFFAAVLIVPRGGWWGLPRYDVLLALALLIQALMWGSKLETTDELKAIVVFHLVGFALEVFKTSPGVRSWSYPDFAYSKVFGVPLFAGFMYAAVGSYIIQAWRLFDLRVLNHPPPAFAWLAAALIYANFFTHHYIGDFRWWIGAGVLALYARSVVVFRPLDRDRRMPLLLSFVLIGFFVWLAENISTFLGVWRYPNQLGAWSAVHVGKWSSWSLLIVLTFTLVTGLKHIKARVHRGG